MKSLAERALCVIKSRLKDVALNLGNYWELK
jgi:hypothetical protein